MGALSTILRRSIKASPQEVNIGHTGRTAFDVGALGYGIQSSLDAARPTMDDLVRRYGMWVHRCIQINSQTAAGVPFKLMRRVKNPDLRQAGVRMGLFKSTDVKTRAYLRGRMNVQPSYSVRAMSGGNTEELVEVPEHWVLALLQDVEKWGSGYSWREAMFSDLEIFGRAFTVLGDGATPKQMWRAMPQRMNLVRHPVDFVSEFLYGQAPDLQRFDPEEVLWFRLYDPIDPWGGMGPTEAWLKTIDASFAVQDFQVWLMNRGGAPDYLVKSEAELTPDQKKTFRTEWRRLFGRLRNRLESVGFLSGKGEIERLGDTPKELEFSTSEANKRDQIGQAYGVPKSLLTTDDVNRANATDARRQHMELTIWPRIQRFEDVINEQLVQRFDSSGVFIMHENPIDEDSEIKIKQRESKLRSGYSVNEIRTSEGDEMIDDPAADTPMMASGLVPIGTLPGGPLSLEDGEEHDAEPEMVEGETDPKQVLTGQQITAASAIVQAVIDDKIPIESARGQLVVMFNLSEEQANMILAGVEGFEKPEPEVPPMAPGQPPQGEEDAPPPEKGLSLRLDRLASLTESIAKIALANAMTIKHTLNGKAEPQPTNVQVNIAQPPTPNFTVKLGDSHFAMPTPEVTIHQGDTHVTTPEQAFHIETPQSLPPVVHVDGPEIHVPQSLPPVVHMDAPEIHVDIPKAMPPTVHVDAPEIHVDVPQGLPPSVHVDAPDIHVDVPEQKMPVIHVEQPNITVEPPEQHFKMDAPDVRVDVPAPIVNVEAPNVNVEPAQVNVPAPVVNVQPPDVHVEPPDITVEAPTVNVEAPQVTMPEIKVEPPVTIVIPQIEINEVPDDA